MRQPSRREADRSGYLSRDTIASLATAAGGAVSIIRVSGPGSDAALAALSPDLDVSGLQPRTLYRTWLRTAGGEPLDDALVARFVSPRSFTGENCVELHIHGGTFTATRVLEALRDAGARQALPGEFSFRAVRNGKMTLSQAEGLADLIAASNEGAVSVALSKLAGDQSRWVTEVAEELRRLAALGEAGIDFSDQDLDELSLGRLQDQVRPVLRKLEVLAGSFARGSRIQDGIRVAFIGLPNAGKSSYFNALLGEDRSIVSEIAGTTRDVVREKLTLKGARQSVTLRLEDTAGLRDAEDRVERLGVDRTIAAAKGADLILLVVDATTGEEGWSALEAQWGALGKPAAKTVGIATKCDLGSGRGAAERLSRWGVALTLETSSESGAGIAESASAIADFCERFVGRAEGELVLTRVEHLRAAEEAIEHLKRSLSAPGEELFAADLHHAIQALSPLIGSTVPDDILGRIFSKFCIGK